MELLVVGGSGYLGHELTRQARVAGDRIVATYHRQAQAGPGVDWRRLDLRVRDDVAALIDDVRPTVIINVASRQDDWAVTAEGGKWVATASAAAGARLVYVSSDAVFSGAAPQYDESCEPDPTTAYGAAKAAAETAITDLAPAAIIARTSLIVGSGDSPREKLVHALISGTATGALFTDDVRCPIQVSDPASALLELARSTYSGVHHLAGSDALSRYELGLLIARRDGLDETRLPSARRADAGPPDPASIRLDCALTQSRLTTRLQGARTFLAPEPGGTNGS